MSTRWLYWLLPVLLLALLPACATRQAAQPEVNNPWKSRAESLARSGVAAMGRGRMHSAEQFFQRSLQAATLAGDRQLVALDWYNIGRARAASGDAQGARAAFSEALAQARSSGDAVNMQRAGLALAMLDASSAGTAGDDALLQVPENFPVDVQLAAARLAVLHGKPELARHAFERVLALAGPERSGLLYAARARLGLARLAHASGDPTAAAAQLNSAIALLRRAGDPPLLRQAMLLAAQLAPDAALRALWKQRADDIGRALHDTAGE